MELGSQGVQRETLEKSVRVLTVQRNVDETTGKVQQRSFKYTDE